MREPMLSDPVALRLAFGTKEGGAPPGDGVDWVRVGHYQPVAPAPMPDVGTARRGAGAPLKHVTSDAAVTAFLTVERSFADPVGLLRGLGVLPEHPVPARLVQVAEVLPSSAGDAPRVGPSGDAVVRSAPPTAAEKARTATVTSAALDGYDVDPNHCNIAFNATMNRLGIHDFDGMLANGIMRHLSAHPEKFRRVTKDEAAEAAAHGRVVAAGIDKVEEHGHIQTILGATMREPGLAARDGQVFPLAVSGSTIDYIGAKNRGVYTVRDAYDRRDWPFVQFFIIK